MDRPPSRSRGPMSMDALLDEDSREILASIDRRRPSSPLPKIRASRTATPPPPARSMLNVDEYTPRRSSIAGIGVGVTSPLSPRRPGKELDPSDPSSWTSPHSSKPNSPVLTKSSPKITRSDVDERIPPLEEPRSRHGSMAAALSGELGSLHVGLTSKRPESPARKVHLSPPLTLSHVKTSSVSTADEDIGRITKDDLSGEEDAVDSDASSDEDDAARGRQRNGNTTDVISPASDTTSSPETKRVPHSQLFIKEPSISVTPAEDTGRQMQQPSGSRRGSVMSLSSNVSDDEAAAIRKAKTLALNISPLDTTVRDRHVRVILRGDWHQFNTEAEARRRTSRLYLLCTDMSVEASYAMEWVVGTMLRDGDTLLAINAIEDENAGKPTEAETSTLTAEGNKAGKDASSVMDTLTRQTTQGGGTSLGLGAQAKYTPATEMESLTGSMDARRMSRKEMDRLKAVDKLTEDFVKLVRKTTLQVRCMIEIVHCKSPKHLILGAIDQLDPTLCVVGTRGRSSLKGVLLGSFSNYLVTKSSVPVMVARRRMKKPHASGARISSNKIRLTNNLSPGGVPGRKGLTGARID